MKQEFPAVGSLAYFGFSSKINQGTVTVTTLQAHDIFAISWLSINLPLFRIFSIISWDFAYWCSALA
jgi:hypothetical protein